MSSGYYVDGIVVVARDAATQATRWGRLVGAQPDGRFYEDSLGAYRIRLLAGHGAIDVLTPAGEDGPIAAALHAHGEHIFASAISHPRGIGALPESTRQAASKLTDGSLMLEPDLLDLGRVRIIVRPPTQREAVGRLRQWYEATMLVDDAGKAIQRIARLLDLDTSLFRELASEEFRYSGGLTMFRHGELSRFEIVHPWDEDSTMRRYFAKHGQSIYMAFAESTELNSIGSSIRAEGATFVDHRRDGALSELWVPPRVLGGVMLGVSIPDEAWEWSSGESYISQELA